MSCESGKRTGIIYGANLSWLMRTLSESCPCVRLASYSDTWLEGPATWVSCDEQLEVKQAKIGVFCL